MLDNDKLNSQESNENTEKENKNTSVISENEEGNKQLKKVKNQKK